jgi:hypothetical protein
MSRPSVTAFAFSKRRPSARDGPRVASSPHYERHPIHVILRRGDIDDPRQVLVDGQVLRILGDTDDDVFNADVR